MKRIFTIAIDQIRHLSVSEVIPLIKRFLFGNDTVFIYLMRPFHDVSINADFLNGIIIRKGNIHELEAIEERISPTPWEFRCHKYDGVKDFFVAEGKAGIQHLSWIYYQGHPNRLIQLGPRDAEIKYSLTLSPFRGKGLYPAVLRKIVRHLQQKGFSRVFISVVSDNASSIRGIEKAGFAFITTIHLRKILGFQLSKKYRPPEVPI